MVGDQDSGKPQTMPSPVVSSDFDIQNFSGDLCERIRKLLEMSNTLQTWFEWAFDSSGNPTTEFLASLASIGVPVGAITWLPINATPEGYLVANGQAVSRTTYAALFARYSTTFGSGDGSNTFNLPDLQNKYLMGASGIFPIGGTGGESTHTLIQAEIPSFNISLPHEGFLFWPFEADNGSVGNSSGNDFGVTGASSVSSGGGGQPHNNLPPYMAGLWLVKH